jgi:hypothetical protein
MKLPLSIDKYYTTHLSKAQVANELNQPGKEKKYGGLRVDRFVKQTDERGFIIGGNTTGLDGFTLAKYPIIKGNYFSENPLVINIVIRPNYFTTIFLAIFAFTFILGPIFVNKINFDGVRRIPTIMERFEFIGLGCLPGLWCYFGFIRPIKKAENWIVDKLGLRPTHNNGTH